MALNLHLLVTGAPLVADLDPNAAVPDPRRVFTTPVRRGIATGGPVQVMGLLLDGTSCDFTVWVRSDELAAWFKVGDTTNVAAARVGLVGGVPCDAQVFVQLTAVAGAPTRFGVAIGYGSSEVGAPEPDAWKQPVRLATTVALPACALVGNRLTAAANGTIPAATTDGSAVAAGNDILVKNQGGVAAHLQNGPYRVVDVGLAGGGGRPWILDRTPHCDESGEVFDGMMVTVAEGATMAGHIFEQVSSGPIDLNVTALEFRDYGTLLALVTALTSGSVSDFGAHVAWAVLQSDGTAGGVWNDDYQHGATPATAGAARFTQADAIEWRDPTGAAHNVVGLTVAANKVTIGTGGASMALDVSALIELQIAATPRLSVEPAIITLNVPSLHFGSTVAGPYITQDNPAVDVAGTSLAVMAQAGGAAFAVPGQVGGGSWFTGGFGGAGTAALASGRGGAGNFHGGNAGQNFGGGGNDGGAANLNGGEGTGAGRHGPVYIAWNHTYEVIIGNAVDNPPISQAGTGLVWWLGASAFGAVPALAGSLRLTDASTCTYRTGGADYAAWNVNGAVVTFGGAASGARPATVNVDAATTLALQIGGASQVSIAVGAITTPSSITLSPLGGGADDAPQIKTALDTGKKTVLSAGTYTLATPIYPLSNSLLECLPGVHFISTCNPATEFPFSLSYLLTGVTTHLEAAPVVGSRTITTHDTVPIGSLIMIRDLTGGAWRRNFYRTTNVAGGGTPYTVTLDRPLNFSFDTNDEVAFCTRIAEKIHLYFNGADITGTGVRAIYAAGAQHCTYHDLHVIGTGWTHSGISWDEGDYDCHSYRCSVESDGTACAGGGGYTIESSEHCSHESPIVNNIAGVGILLPDNVDCWVSNPEIHKCSTGIWIYATDATKGSDNVRIDSGKIGCVSANGVQARVASKNTLVRGVKVATAGGSCFLIDGACDNTTLEDCTGTGATTAGIEVSASTRTKLRTVTTDSSGYGIISDSDLDIIGWSATGCQAELSVTAGTPKITVRTFVTSGASLGGGFHYRLPVAGTFDFADGSITVPNGDYCIRMNAAGTLKLRNVACATSNAYHIYLDGAVAGVTYDLGGNSFTGVATTAIWISGTSHKVWKEGETAAPTVSVGHTGSTVAQLNWGTVACNGATEVDTPNLWITGATDPKKIVWGLGTIDAAHAPQLQPFEDKARAAGHFYTKAQTALDTSVWNYRLVE